MAIYILLRIGKGIFGIPGTDLGGNGIFNFYYS